MQKEKHTSSKDGDTSFSSKAFISWLAPMKKRTSRSRCAFQFISAQLELKLQS
jgi:hypothetical protein